MTAVSGITGELAAHRVALQVKKFNE